MQEMVITFPGGARVDATFGQYTLRVVHQYIVPA